MKGSRKVDGSVLSTSDVALASSSLDLGIRDMRELGGLLGRLICVVVVIMMKMGNSSGEEEGKATE